MTVMQKLPGPSARFDKLATFTQAINITNIPKPVTRTAVLLMLDLIGVMAAGSKLERGRIARNHAVHHWASGSGAPFARLLFDGRHTSLPGFGFAMGTQLDNLDAHDGWQPSKGHAGAPDRSICSRPSSGRRTATFPVGDEGLVVRHPGVLTSSC